MIRFIADHYGVTITEVKGQVRDPRMVQARSILARILRERGHTYPMIARMLGRKDHSTVIHMIKTFDNRAKYNPEMLTLYHALRVNEAKVERLAA